MRLPRALLFLDIDGVLLVRDKSRFGYRVAAHAGEFLAVAVMHFDTRWLSSRCSFGGDPDETRRAFRLAGLPLKIRHGRRSSRSAR